MLLQPPSDQRQVQGAQGAAGGSTMCATPCTQLLLLAHTTRRSTLSLCALLQLCTLPFKLGGNTFADCLQANGTETCPVAGVMQV